MVRDHPSGADLRLPAVAAAAWVGALAALTLPAPVWASTAVLALGGVVVLRRRGRPVRTVLTLLAAFSALAGGATVRSYRIAHDPVAELGHRGAAVHVVVSVTSDPRVESGRFGPYVTFRGRLRQVTASGAVLRVAAPVLVLAEPSWSEVRLGSVLAASGRLAAPQDADLSAVLRPRGPPVLVDRARPWWRAADRVRASLRDSVSGVPERYRALVPALVVGDDAGLAEELADDFATTGLTHLLAVSGTNLTLLLGFVLLLARWAGVHGRWRLLVAGLGVLGFVLLARPEPSVLRAAVMGAVGLVALGTGGAQRGARTLGAAVLVLLLVDPWLALRAGFALSVLATAGIVFVAPVWCDALTTWLPRWLAAAVAVPAAAQLACTPVVAALSGQVSLVAVLANLLAAPVVGPATVLGLAGGLAGLVWPPTGRLLGTAAGWCVAWLVLVAEHGAGLPRPSVEGVAGPTALVLLAVLCLLAVPLLPRLLARREVGIGGTVLLVVVVLVRLPLPGWPPDGWVLVACDVGQGDALVLNAGSGSAVVVDAGPDPRAVDRCLRRLGVSRVPLVVLTHFHSDHVGGLSGVLRRREVGGIVVTPLADPPEGVGLVREVARAAGVPVSVAAYGSTWEVGPVALQVLWPTPDQPRAGPGDGSTANNASVVLLGQVHDVRLLLSGDLEPEGQDALAGLLPGLTVDVLKVPHHGSRYQDLDFLLSLRARVALVSVGADNDYGHPSKETLAPLQAAGTEVLRTDIEGDLAVLEQRGQLLAVTSR